MTGQLIPTGVTFGTGRNSINDAFSGTAYMNNISIDSGGNLSAGTGGGVIFSAGTDLYDIFGAGATSGNLWSASTGVGSIIANNGTGNLASGSFSFVTGSGNTSSSSQLSFIIGGNGNLIENDYNNAILNSIDSYNFRAITALGRQHWGNTVISSKESWLVDSTGSTMISCSGLTLEGVQWVTGMQRAYIDEYIDLKPQIILPRPSVGRIFFSGSPLFKLMINTGGTLADWIIV